MISRIGTILLLVSTLVLCPLYGWAEITSIVEGRVVKVADGDTVTVLAVGYIQQKVRLEGIDCPEKGQPFGQAAKKFTSGLVANKEVRVEVKGKDRYGRLIGEVFLPNGMSLNRQLLINGYAWWYEKYSKDKTLQFLESKAREQKQGLWSTPNAIAPWEWRKLKRKETSS